MQKTIAKIIFLLLFFAQVGKVFAKDLLLDPGHLVKSHGATSCSGKSENWFNSALADVIAAKVLSIGIPVTLTHKANEDISLLGRSRIASGNKVLLSIHHDSVQSQFIQWKSKHPCSTKAEGYSIFVSQKNKYYAESLKYAKKLGLELSKRGYKPSLHHAEKIKGENRELLDSKLGIYRFDDLLVLKFSGSPALLLEAAVIVNPQDEIKAESESYKNGIADAVVETIKNE